MHLEKFRLDQIQNGRLSAIIHFHMADILIKSSYVISLINSRECKLYQVITASKPNYSYCTYVFLLFRDFYKCNIHHPFSQGGVISKISVCSYNYIFQHTCMP